MGDPYAAAVHARQAPREGGTVMLVEPMAGDRLEDNLNPVGRACYGFSTLICTPASLSQPGRVGLGVRSVDGPSLSKNRGRQTDGGD